jgi:hypothetical protein
MREKPHYSIPKPRDFHSVSHDFTSISNYARHSQGAHCRSTFPLRTLLQKIRGKFVEGVVIVLGKIFLFAQNFVDEIDREFLLPG